LKVLSFIFNFEGKEFFVVLFLKFCEKEFVKLDLKTLTFYISSWKSLGGLLDDNFPSLVFNNFSNNY